MNNTEWTHRILEHRIAVSDTWAFTHSEASNSCFSPDRGLFYTVYTASRRNYGESHDVLAMNITPVCQPHRAVKQYVGSSEYKVDIAVEHPNYPGCYVAGIECDGNS